MTQQQIIIIALVVLACLIGFWFYLRHAKTKPSKVVKSGLDLERVLADLGGKENIHSVSANGSKVSFIVTDTRSINQEGLKALGASGIVISKDKVTVIFGKSSEALAQELSQVL